MAQDMIWFLDTLVRVHVTHTRGADGLSVLEHRAPRGDSPPRHIHETEDEIFHILEGDLSFEVSGELTKCGPGGVLLAPKGVAHTYRVDSVEGARWMTITARGDFERFVRAVGRPAKGEEVPPRGAPPSPEAIEELASVAARFGIRLVGPPLG